MPRKKWSAQTEVTPSLLKLREKRRWQIALRRYVIERNISTFYAPYFGLDVENIRIWFEMQFDAGTTCYCLLWFYCRCAINFNASRGSISMD